MGEADMPAIVHYNRDRRRSSFTRPSRDPEEILEGLRTLKAAAHRELGRTMSLSGDKRRESFHAAFFVNHFAAPSARPPGRSSIHFVKLFACLSVCLSVFHALVIFRISFSISFNLSFSLSLSPSLFVSLFNFSSPRSSDRWLCSIHLRPPADQQVEPSSSASAVRIVRMQINVCAWTYTYSQSRGESGWELEWSNYQAESKSARDTRNQLLATSNYYRFLLPHPGPKRWNVVAELRSSGNEIAITDGDGKSFEEFHSQFLRLFVENSTNRREARRNVTVKNNVPCIRVGPYHLYTFLYIFSHASSLTGLYYLTLVCVLPMHRHVSFSLPLFSLLHVRLSFHLLLFRVSSV